MRVSILGLVSMLLFCVSAVQAGTTASVLPADSGDALSLRATAANIFRFDMQPVGAVTKPGYTAITDTTKYTPALGYGFTTLSDSRARDGGRLAPLCRDYIAAGQADFRVDVPNGAYDVWMLTGDSQLGIRAEWLYFNRQLLVNGKTVYHDDITPAYYFKHGYYKHYKDFWHPGMSYYDTFIVPHFHTHHFQADVTNGHLNIQWRNLPMDGMIVSPVADHAAVAKEWAHLKVEQRQGVKIEETPDPVEPMPQVSSADTARGFILFRRPANVKVYPTSRPKAGERIDSLKSFAAQGQTEGMHFSLLPVKDLGNVAVRATAFHSQADGGQVIPVDAVTVRVVRYGFYEVGGSRSKTYHYQIAPYAVDQHEYVPCPKGTTWTWWVDVKVPPQTPAGVYQGDLRIEPQNAPAFNLPVKLHVMGFKLAALPIVQGYYFTAREPWFSTFRGTGNLLGINPPGDASIHPNVLGANLRNDPAIRPIIDRNERQNLAFMKSLGLNSLAWDGYLGGFWTFKDGYLQFKPNNAFVHWMDIFAKSGMSPFQFYGFQAYPMFNYLSRLLPEEYSQPFTKKWVKQLRHVITYLNAMGKHRGWPEIVWCVSDEAGNRGLANVKKGARAAALLQDMPGVTTMASMNGSLQKMIVPHIDIATPNWAFPITKENIKFIHDSGAKFWLYNCGTSRMMLGLYPWRVGATGRWQWEWNQLEADPWDDLDGQWGNHHYNVVLAGPNGLVGTLKSVALRAGINDHRYAATLEAAIAAAKSDPAKAKVVKQANEFLIKLRQRLPVDLRPLMTHRFDPKAASADFGGEFKNTDVLDQVRLTMARYIVKLGGESSR